MTDANESNIELSIVGLCYKSEEALYSFVERIQSVINPLNISYEIILVANYHPDTNDTTPEYAKKIATEYDNITSVTLKKEGAMGWDLRTGLALAKGKFITFIDGDGQMPEDDILKIYDKMKSGEYDLIKTFRVKRYDGWYRSFQSRIYNLVFKILFMPNLEIHDVNSKPKIFTREAYQQMNLKSDDWFIDAEIMLFAYRHKLRIYEVPCVFLKNQHRKSFVDFNTVTEFLINIFKYRFLK
jgi:glycosyltransferase involved in cell wall biosynthesis